MPVFPKDKGADPFKIREKPPSLLPPISRTLDTRPQPMAKIIGIDLGTTKSCVAVMKDGKPLVLTNSEGARTTPSVVAFPENGDILVGSAALGQAVRNPRITVSNIKRFMGKAFAEISANLNDNTYKLERNTKGNVAISIRGKLITPQVVSALILAKMKKTAEDALGEKVRDAVITVPAYFNEAQRQATKEAGEIAGLKVHRILNEPTAAALAYGINKTQRRRVAVFDLGGGTFDISILEFDNGFFQVKSTNGDTHLGGNDFDKVIMDWVAAEFKQAEGLDLLTDAFAWQRVKEAAQKAKIELSTARETEIFLPYILDSPDGPRHLKRILERTTFESLALPIFEKCIDCCKEAMRQARNPGIDDLIMVGESSRIPKILEMVEAFFHLKPRHGVDMLEAVAIGAAIEGGILNRESGEMLLADVVPISLGIETQHGIMSRIIEKNTIVPVRRSTVFSTAADNQTAVEVHVLQGERPMSSQNKTLGKFTFNGIDPAPKGKANIEVSFDLDASGILHVTAKDSHTGKSFSAHITADSTATKEELDQWRSGIQHFEQRMDEQRTKKEKLSQAEALIYRTEKFLLALAGTLTAGNLTALHAAYEELKSAHSLQQMKDLEAAVAAVSSFIDL